MKTPIALRTALVRVLVAVCLLGGCAMARAQSPSTENPLTVNEICTKLKSGATSDDVITALSQRRLLESPTLADQQTLQKAGATQHLLDVLKSGTYTLSPFDAGSARLRVAAGSPFGGGIGASGNPGHMASLLKGKLVTFQNGSLKGYDDARLSGKKYFAIYYSAHWCPPCRQFTPKLVEFYQQLAQQHPEVEVVFVSSDETPQDMQNYMKEEKMPWAALRFDRKAMEHELTHYCGSGIPDLVVVDGDGKVLSDSYEGKNYVGPYKVANDLARLLHSPVPFNG